LEKVRAFIAVDLEDEALRQGISDFQQSLIREGADAKLVAPQNLHLTLRFLGEIEEDAVQRVIDEMRGLSFQPLEIQFKGVGAFPSATRINVVWVAVSRGQDDLREIAEALEPKLRKIGIPSDKKGFSPHLTVARIRSGRNREKITRLLSQLRERDFGAMRSESVRLKRSILTPDGPAYSTIFEVRP